MTTSDHLLDAITIKIETPTVKEFFIADQSSPATDAYPLAWVGMPGANGAPTGFGFAMAGDTPLAMKGVGMWAKVTNNTHYDLNINFVQIVDSFKWTANYDNGGAKLVPHSASGASLLDNGIYYRDAYATVRKGAVEQLHSEQAIDAPSFSQPLQDSTTNPMGALKNLSMDDRFSTSVAVYAGSMPGASPYQGVPGVPIALSTAKWMLKGSATVGPTGAIVPGSGVMVSGPILADGSLPTNNNWNSPGDGKISYLYWSNSAANAIGAGNILNTGGGLSEPSLVAVFSPEPRSRTGPTHAVGRHNARGRAHLVPPQSLLHACGARALVPQVDSPQSPPRVR